MVVAVQSAGKIVAANYVRNQQYFNQADSRPAGLLRVLARSPAADPFYKAAASSLASFIKAAGNVEQSANNMLKPGSSAFRSRTAVSSEPASVAAAASSGATLKTHHVKVKKIAAAQINSGSFLARHAPSAVSSGTHQLKILSGGKSVTVSAVITHGDTNEQALTKLKDAINKAPAGVTASLVSDSSGGEKKLELRSELTGVKNAFSVTDLSGNAAAATGIANIKSTASDAIYSVNGGPDQTSGSNTVELEKGKVSATLIQPASGSVDIQVKPDAAEALQQVKQLVGDYNAMLARLSHAGAYVNPSVKRGLADAASGYDSIGVRKQSDGTLKLDETAFKKSVDTRFDRTVDAISGRFGLADRLAQAADRLQNVPPASLLNPQARDWQAFGTYRATMGYSFQMPASGLLFDGNF